MRRVASLVLLACVAFDARAQSSTGAFDLNYSRESRAAIGAHHLCSGLWVVGRVYKRSAEEILAQDIAPFRLFSWEKDFKYDVDSVHHSVTVRGDGIPPRSARYNGDQGCSIMPRGETEIHFKPVSVPRNLPDAAKQPWPMGDLDATASFADVKADVVQAALDWGMAQKEHNTRAIVFVYRGKIVGERYAPGWTKDTPEISWSEGKSITGALVGILAKQGVLTLDDVAPIKEWQAPGDPRGQIRIRNLMNMSSGLDFTNRGLTGPESYTRENKHMRVYFDGIDVFEHSINNALAGPPNTRWRYQNSDPLTLGKIVRDKVEARGESYLTFPQRALFDRIGVRNAVLETDAWGNFIMTGFDYLSARDWARFGLLHLHDGVWQGQRILPEGWTTFVSTPAPADPTHGYGGMFWVNRGHAWAGVPEDAYRADGAMGQYTMIVPSRDVVIVRMGPSPGDSGRYFAELSKRLLDALPVAGAPSQASPVETLVVLNKSEHSASLIDPATGATIVKLPVGRGPHELALSPDGRTAYVANFGRFGVFPAGDTMHTVAGNTMTVIDVVGRKVKTTYDFGTHTGEHGVAVSRDGAHIWVTSETPNALMDVDAATGRIDRVWPTQQERTHLVVPAPGDKTFYITNTVSGSVSVIDRESGSVRTIPTGAGAEGITVSPDGREVWVAWRNDSKISVISTATGAIVETFAAGGEGPQRVQFTPDGAQVWASNVRSNTLTVFDARTRKLLGSVPVGAGPGGIVFSSDSRRGYFALAGANRIAVVDVASRTVLRNIETGLEPDGIALSIVR
jgi:YVTN family beta-propeller protein